jgi:transaldolase
MAKLALAGVNIEKITRDLEADGVAKFESSWVELMNSVKAIALGNA